MHAGKFLQGEYRMSSNVTIVMYHYVRPLQDTNFPEIKGLDVSDFENQLDYLKTNYSPITASDLILAKKHEKKLPDNPVLLTFDDGYKDHIKYAMPRLLERNMPGIFFPISKVTRDKKILDVNKVHFILASVKDKHKLKNYIDKYVDKSNDDHEVKKIDHYENLYLKKNRYDGEIVNYIKRMLQVGLPENKRAHLSDQLFKKFVTNDEISFAEELYLSIEDIKEMFNMGMEIGSHGHSHPWLNNLSKNDQFYDIDTSIKFFSNAGIPMDNFLFCYPYGAYNEDTISVLEALNCSCAFNVSPKKFNLESCSLMELPRLDTNDIPRAL